MKVGTICKLKVDCLGNKAGTLGVVFYGYDHGFQVIFENGKYDGFSTKCGVPIGKAPFIQRETRQVEADYFLEEVGFEESLASYKFTSVIQVSNDFDLDVFSIAWSEGWKKTAAVYESEPKAFKSDEDDGFEKCLVQVEDSGTHRWLWFAREKGDVTVTSMHMLSAAMDYEDFSHFEYADSLEEYLLSRWIQDDKTLYPKYVVFKRK